MKTRDMTQGVIWKQMVLYAIPLLLGNILQQLYNAFDAIVVGRFVSDHALAAVGASGPLMNVLIAFFMGLSNGASVIISQSFGAKDDESLRKATHTAMLTSVIIGAVLMVLGMVFSPMLLRMVSTPEEIMADAIIYLRIFFAGAVGLTLYNMGAAILRAVGDSKRPLYFLAVSAFINIVGNLVFVLVFDMGIAGVAYSTIIAQFISAILVVWVLFREEGGHRLELPHMHIHGGMLKEFLRIGMPGGIQSALISFSNVFVQSYINKMGASVVAGYSVASKVDAFVMLPGQTMAMTTTTFVGQNLGAKKVSRARQGVKWGLGLAVGITLMVAAAVLIFVTPVTRIFSTSQDVFESAKQFIYVLASTYVIMTVSQVLPGALRGAGDVRVPTLIGIVSFVLLRQVWLFFATKVSYTITTVALGFPVAWALAAIALVFYYRKSDWSRFGPVGEAE